MNIVPQITQNTAEVIRLLARQLRDELGWSIIPILPKSKKAAIEWKEYQTRHATDVEIDSWWRDGSRLGIGVVTGKLSNLTVIDVDSYKPGGASFPLEVGQLEVPWTVTSHTGSGGTHYFFRYHPDIPTGTDTFRDSGFPNVDTRSEGGYAVLPPSSNENGTYSWVNVPYGLNSVSIADVC